MSDDAIQILAMIILALSEMYAAKDLTLFAVLWDFIASVAGAIANFFAALAMRARLHYFEAVQA